MVLRMVSPLTLVGSAAVSLITSRLTHNTVSRLYEHDDLRQCDQHCFDRSWLYLGEGLHDAQR